jgi:hypothetical protein
MDATRIADGGGEMSDTCRCNCGYTCNRKCGLPLMECMKLHYVVDCDHDFTGEAVEIFDGLGMSVTCKKCGMLAINHSMEHGA